MKRSLLYALLLPLLISCGTGGEQKCIVAADSLMENDPDSAYKLLRREYGKAKDLSRGNRMRYLLTYAEAMNKAYIPMDTVKFMDDVLDYYYSHGDANEFSSSDISNLLGTSQQRVTNIKSSINEKLFHKKGSKSLLANLSLL